MFYLNNFHSSYSLIVVPMSSISQLSFVHLTFRNSVNFHFGFGLHFVSFVKAEFSFIIAITGDCSYTCECFPKSCIVYKLHTILKMLRNHFYRFFTHVSFKYYCNSKTNDGSFNSILYKLKKHYLNMVYIYFYSNTNNF